MARPLCHSRWKHAREEGGFSIVEIVVAMLLLAVVAAGVSMAFVSSVKVQGKARSKAGMSAAAQRIFEHLQGDRAWMESCATSYATWCNVSSAVPASLLKEDSLGKSLCTGANPFRLQLTTAKALAIDSKSDGTGSTDKDGVVPDYFRVYLKVDVPQPGSCTKDFDRLGHPGSAVIDSALDPRGKVPLGSVTVEVCQVNNQVDDRMSVAGCPNSGASNLRMLGCPPDSTPFIGTPAEFCDAAWNWVAPAPYGMSGTMPAPYVQMQRLNRNFSLVSPLGDVYPNTAGPNVTISGTGLYRFHDIPAGTYTVSGLNFPLHRELWTTKVIPTFDADNQIRITVQPDVGNRALIPIRWSPDRKLTIKFTRRVKRRQIQGPIWDGPFKIATGEPTDFFDADPNMWMDLIESFSGGGFGWRAPSSVLTAACAASFGGQPYYDDCHWWDIHPVPPNCFYSSLMAPTIISGADGPDGIYGNADDVGPPYISAGQAPSVPQTNCTSTFRYTRK